MIVVSNTSPLTNLAAIGQFHLLHNLYAELHIADGVWIELNARGYRWPGRDAVAAATWIQRHRVGNPALITLLQRDLDRGEAETIALALDLQADLVLLDEREGRRIAQRMGLSMIGVIGILLEAKAQGQIAQVQPQLEALRHEAGFYLSVSVYQRALVLAGES
jgi:predicted nucleic acid-binding protein